MTTANMSCEVIISVSSPYPSVVNGGIIFRETEECYRVNNLEIPSDLETDEDIKEYLNDLLDQSCCDIASIDSVAISVE